MKRIVLPLLVLFAMGPVMGQMAPLSEYCETRVNHMGFSDEAQGSSAIFLTIENVDASSIRVTIQSATEGDTVNTLLINNSGALLAPQEVTDTTISQLLTWVNPPATANLQILWGKTNTIGLSQLTGPDYQFPFTATCDGAPGVGMPVVAAPTPPCDQADVISFYSDEYADISMSTFKTTWSEPLGIVELETAMIESEEALLYTNLGFVGIEPTSPIDASGMTNFNIDIWTGDLTGFNE